MDLVGAEPPLDPWKLGSENSVVGEKRAVDCDETENLTKKKPRIDYSGDMKRVAELVLVLSAMGKMRGGRKPSDVEKELMVEAKDKLVEICQFMSPQDVIPKDAIRVVMEDLGLNKSADQRLGFRPPKMSIAEKFVLSKRKMEESKKFAAQSGTYSSPMAQAGYGTKPDVNRTTLHTVHKSPALGGYQAASSSVVHVPSLASPASLNGVQSASVSRGSIGTAPGTYRTDGRLNGSIYPSHAQANASGNHGTFSPQSFAVNKVGQGNKAPDHTRSVVGTTEVSTYKVTSYQQPSSVFSNHSDIAKNVQKLLHSRPPQHPSWTPPSTDYMNKSLTCQICKVPIIDVESLLVCDACEHGVHLKCLQSFNQKGIPKGEWHCPTCLISSNGKPLPPKYGRVTRNNTQKASSNTSKTPAPSVKVESQKEKVDPQKITTNGNPGEQNLSHVGSTGGTHSVSASQASNAIVGLGAKVSSDTKKVDEEPLPELNELKSVPKEATGVCSPTNSNKPNDSSAQQHQKSDSLCQQETLISEVKPKVEIVSCPDKPPNSCNDVSNQSQTTCNSQDADKAEQPSNVRVSADPDHKVDASDLTQTPVCNPQSDVRQDAGDVA
ncbi:hypothetical protein MKW94_004719 [Papaver nudicaule]|uniref:PHD-type domain-containing protein n=1 Tax=Papaver nudicaule TaxID=74823 RepID=A0AA41V381_PAPNU|nr:hypothetical protein [Papaver nudicaule]